jgi:hypothetical protein
VAGVGQGVAHRIWHISVADLRSKLTLPPSAPGRGLFLQIIDRLFEPVDALAERVVRARRPVDLLDDVAESCEVTYNFQLPKAALRADWMSSFHLPNAIRTIRLLMRQRKDAPAFFAADAARKEAALQAGPTTSWPCN